MVSILIAEPSGSCAIGKTAQRDNIADGVRPCEGALLGKVGDAPGALHWGKLWAAIAIYARTAATGFFESKRGAQKACLACAIRPNQRDEFACANAETGLSDERGLACVDAQFFGDEFSHGSRAFPSQSI